MDFKKILLLTSIFFLALALPPETSANSVLLDENFDDGSVNDNNPTSWEEVNTNKFGFWSVTDQGQYKGVVETSSTVPILTTTGDVNWTDYIFEVDITGSAGVDRQVVLRRDNSRPPGQKDIAVKYQENNLGHDGLLEIQQNGSVVARTELFKSHIGETHRMKIVALGPNIEVYIDDILYLEYTDETENPHLNGQIGFLVQKGSYDNITLYDNVKVTSLVNSPTKLNLPFNYPNRLEEDNEEDFLSAFNNRVTSVFDHNSEETQFTNFLGDEYRYRDCFLRRLNDHNLDCYDSHNGTDFSSRGGLEIFPAAEGKIVYATDSQNCTNQGRGYGCNVIISHEGVDGLGNYYTIYGHLSKVLVSKGDAVSAADQIGVMGRTGRSTGVHLHFGLLQDLPQAQIGLEAFSTQALVSDEIDWSLLIEDINNEKKLNYGFLKKWLRFKHKKPKHPYYKRGHDTGQLFTTQAVELEPSLSACTYTASGHTFNFIDPSGWYGENIDPWQDSCGVENTNLWKYPLSN